MTVAMVVKVGMTRRGLGGASTVAVHSLLVFTRIVVPVAVALWIIVSLAILLMFLRMMLPTLLIPPPLDSPTP